MIVDALETVGMRADDPRRDVVGRRVVDEHSDQRQREVDRRPRAAARDHVAVAHHRGFRVAAAPHLVAMRRV